MLPGAPAKGFLANGLAHGKSTARAGACRGRCQLISILEDRTPREERKLSLPDAPKLNTELLGPSRVEWGLCRLDQAESEVAQDESRTSHGRGREGAMACVRVLLTSGKMTPASYRISRGLEK